MTTVVYSPRVWLLWVDDIGGVLTSSVLLWVDHIGDVLTSSVAIVG